MFGWIFSAAVLIIAAGWIGARIGRRTLVRDRSGNREPAHLQLAKCMQELSSFQELSYTLFQSLELSAIVQPAVRHLTRFLGADGAILALSTEEEEAITIAAAAGVLEQLNDQVLPIDQAGLVATAMRQRHLEIAHAEGSKLPELVSGTKVVVAAVVPLSTHGLTFGALAAVRETAAPFSSEELRQITTVATHASIALENSRLFDLVKTGKEQWEATFDALATGMAVLDGEGRIRRANRALAEMVDQSPPAVIGTELCGTLFPESPELLEHFTQARRGELTQPITVRSPMKERTLRIGAAGMPGAGGGWLVVQVEDVTERDALAAQLIQQEKMAAVGQLVSGVAHELNNPLSSISGLAEFLIHHEGPLEEQGKHLSLIHEQADRAGRIVRNLLAFARTGPTETNYLDLNEIVRQTTQLIGYELKLREIDLETDLVQELPAIRGDRHEIQQVVVNLLTNAIQAVDENKPDQPRAIRVSTRAEGASTVLSVSDTGPGIPDDLITQIFTPFFTTKRQGQGTGLGLSISYRIVTSHAGRIEVTSNQRTGTTFIVRLPAVWETEPTESAPHRETATAPEEASPVRQLKRRKILLLDDDSAVRQTLEFLFAGEGHQVEAAPSASHALSLLSRHTYDLIVAEPRSTTKSGAMFADAVLERWPELRTRTLFLTADVRPETNEWLQGLGCRYFLKPFDSKDLKAAVAELLAASTPTA
ncbi:MAG: ATP-binding protein [Gemmatimonadales bacterium]